MTYVGRRAAPLWWWLAVVALVLWGLAGCFACVTQLLYGADAMGPATDYDRRLFASLPVWYNAVYIVATFCGLFGSAAMAARSVLAIPLYAISLVAVVVMFGWFFLATDIIAVKGVWTTYFPALIAAVGVFQLWLARVSRARGLIG